jgi:methylmalonyl-CoA epimerase
MLPGLEGCTLDHIAIAVEDIENSILDYSKLGFKFGEQREIVESQKVKTAFCPIDQNGKLELLEATSDESSIAKFLKKNGPGIHHLCFNVPDIIQIQKDLEAQGMTFIYEKPFVGAHECLVNFIHPKSMNGVLIELSQKLKG